MEETSGINMTSAIPATYQPMHYHKSDSIGNSASYMAHLDLAASSNGANHEHENPIIDGHGLENRARGIVGSEELLEEDDIGDEDSQSTEGGIKSEEGRNGESVKKKPRITLARGGACVTCR